MPKREYFVTLQVIVEAGSSSEAENTVENVVASLPYYVATDDCTAVEPDFDADADDLTA